MATTYGKIIKAATKLMSERGFHGTSLQMIADKVGITKSTIVHHFKSKEGILIAILEERIPSTTADLLSIARDENMTGIEKLREFIKYHLFQLEKYWPVMNLYLMESKYLEKKARTQFRKSQSAYWDSVEQILRQTQKDDKTAFKKLDPKVIAIGIIGMCTWTGLWYKKGGKHDMAGIADHFYRTITESVGEHSTVKRIKSDERLKK